MQLKPILPNLKPDSITHLTTFVTSLKVGLALTASLLLGTSSFAQDVDNRSNVFLGGVKYLFDHQTHNQKNNTGILLGGEAAVSDRWSLALEHWELDSDINVGPGESDVGYNRLGANYHFDLVNDWQPYATLGLGHLDIDTGSLLEADSDESAIDLGFGLKRQLNDHLLFRGQALAIFADQHMDFAIGLSVAYAFGTGRSTPAPAAPAPVAAIQLDSDGDGVFDNVDSCPNTPAGRTVNASGCQLDSDRDSVFNALDNCPNTSIQLAVDASGCPILDASQARQTLEINFDTNLADIKPEYSNEIRDFAEFMNQYSNTSVVIEGHTDSDGAAAYNQALSESRATAVMNELVNTYNISASRLSAVGYGEDRPTTTNTTAAGKSANRRIEAEVNIEVETQRLR